MNIFKKSLNQEMEAALEIATRARMEHADQEQYHAKMKEYHAEKEARLKHDLGQDIKSETYAFKRPEAA